MYTVGGLKLLKALLLIVILPACVPAQSSERDTPEERDGFVEVEAERFTSQDKTEKRRWHVTSKTEVPEVSPDGDPPHVQSASGGAYLEILPDSRRTHDDVLVAGENFSNKPGEMAVLNYRVKFNTPGRYYVWVRAYSTGTEDNGIHLGLDGEWPSSGARMQWCEGKNGWRWDSKQRTTEQHCGVPGLIYVDVASAGVHTIAFSMREDGFEFDKFVLTLDSKFVPPE